MATFGYVGRITRRVEILHADRAVVLGGALPTMVIPLHGHRKTESTLVTMVHVLTTTNPAESTLLAVELLLIFIVIETTHRTEVKCKVQRTAGTVLGNWLFGGAPTTDNFRDSIAVNLMGEVLLVVTQPTGIYLAAAWSH